MQGGVPDNNVNIKFTTSERESPGSVAVSESPEVDCIEEKKSSSRDRSSDHASGALALTIGVQHDHAASTRRGCVITYTRDNQGSGGAI